MSTSPGIVIVAVVAASALSCGSEKCAANAAGYAPRISAADFPNSTRIDNGYFPLVPGTVFKFVDNDNNPTEITVTSETRAVLGIDCVAVHDVAKSAAGEVLEDTFDWYAQDKDGNVWYFGEDTRAFQAGRVVSTEGSWEAGVACAQPGIIMKANPLLGDSYFQEYREGVAEDRADVLSLTESITVPHGAFDHCVMTKDYTALEPGKFEHKYFCPGVGQVSAVDVVSVGTGGREDLVSVTH